MQKSHFVSHVDAFDAETQQVSLKKFYCYNKCTQWTIEH